MQFMLDVFALPNNTIAMISVVCGIGVASVMKRFTSPLAGIVMFPVAVSVSVCAMQTVRVLELLPGKGLEPWLLTIVLSSAAGMAFGLLLMAITTHLRGFVAARRVRRLPPIAVIRHIWPGRRANSRM